jgi:hypothetical protein
MTDNLYEHCMFLKEFFFEKKYYGVFFKDDTRYKIKGKTIIIHETSFFNYTTVAEAVKNLIDTEIEGSDSDDYHEKFKIPSEYKNKEVIVITFNKKEYEKYDSIKFKDNKMKLNVDNIEKFTLNSLLSKEKIKVTYFKSKNISSSEFINIGKSVIKTGKELITQKDFKDIKSGIKFLNTPYLEPDLGKNIYVIGDWTIRIKQDMYYSTTLLDKFEKELNKSINNTKFTIKFDGGHKDGKIIIKERN